MIGDRQAPTASSPLTATTPCPSPKFFIETMSGSISHLPVEILEQILLHLPGQDIIKVDAVRRVTATSTQLIADFSAA